MLTRRKRSNTTCPTCMWDEKAWWDKLWELLGMSGDEAERQATHRHLAFLHLGRTWGDIHRQKFIQTGDIAEFERMVRHRYSPRN